MHTIREYLAFSSAAVSSIQDDKEKHIRITISMIRTILDSSAYQIFLDIPHNHINNRVEGFAMKHLVNCSLIAGAILSMLPYIVSAQIYESISQEQLKAIFLEQGYSLKGSTERTFVWTIDGMITNVILSSSGSQIMFHAAFSDGNATMKKVNNWNKNMQFSRSYLDDEGDPILELDLDLEGGITKARIVDFLKTCRTSYLRWTKEVVM